MPVSGNALANTAILTDGNNNLSFQTIPTNANDCRFILFNRRRYTCPDRTFNVGAGSGINVNANDIDVDATTTATASKVVARDGAGNVYATYFNGIATRHMLTWQKYMLQMQTMTRHSC